MDNYVKVTASVSLLLITSVAALYHTSRRRKPTQNVSFKVDDTSKKSCSSSILIDKASTSDDNDHLCEAEATTTIDRLSELPDDILSHIITFLSLRDVARVATLSKNWRKVPVSLSCLDLDWRIMSGMEGIHKDYKCKQHRQAYLNGVGQVLQTYKDQNIVSFRSQSCCIDNKCAAVNQWISFAAKNKGLQSLALEFVCGPGLTYISQRTYSEVNVISGLFLSQFSLLKNLHLQSCIVRLENNWRWNNHLNSLVLHDVFLEGTQWTHFLSCLSTLQFLSLTQCNLPKKLCIDDQLPLLSSLQIELRLDRHEHDVFELELSAGNLKNFNFMFYSPVECSFSDLSSLEDVNIYYDCHNHAAGVIMKRLAAKAFKLKSLLVRGYNSLGNKLTCQDLLFCSVLSFHIGFKTDNGDFVKLFPHLLKSFPLLKKLDIQFPRPDNGGMHKDPIPYSHNNLKEIKLWAFEKQWIRAATFLLQSAVELNCMVLTKSVMGYIPDRSFVICRHESSEKECEIFRKALAGKASSPHVKVIIEN